jgi:hypothetical protein
MRNSGGLAKPGLLNRALGLVRLVPLSVGLHEAFDVQRANGFSPEQEEKEGGKRKMAVSNTVATFQAFTPTLQRPRHFANLRLRVLNNLRDQTVILCAVAFKELQLLPHASQLRKLSRLLNPRIGRGISH